jgi:hypothetical protein
MIREVYEVMSLIGLVNVEPVRSSSINVMLDGVMLYLIRKSIIFTLFISLPIDYLKITSATSIFVIVYIFS